jgi:His-Xaa-Ser system protein HxsD
MVGIRIPVRLVGDSVEVEFDESVYSLDTIQRASLKYSDLASIAIYRGTPGSLCAKAALFDDAGISADELGKVLVNEVMDQALRERIAVQTSTERNLILSYTFSRSKLISS